MSNDNNMDKFLEWLVKPMSKEDVSSWYLANNITLELTELFRDFCVSFLQLLEETYLGDDYDNLKDTKVGMTEQQKKDHLKWCWERTISNFQKEEIYFIFNEKDTIFFKELFYDIFYNQNDKKGQESVFDFFVQIFGYETKKSKSDIEIFTDIYKTLERSLKNN
jgi:hypothetical protein